MKFRLNRQSLEKLKALVRAGKFTDDAWSFSVDDSNSLLGDPANWTVYAQWFLGIGATVPESMPQNGTTDQTPHKDWYAYPFGKGDTASLGALRAASQAAKAAGDSDVATAADEVLAIAAQIATDKATASGAACDLSLSLTGEFQIRASAAGKLPPTFEADAYTGVPMRLDGWRYPVVIDYDGLDLTAKSRPVLRDHDESKQLGHTTKFSVVNGVLKVAGIISATGAHVDEVVEAAKNNFPWQVSVQTRVLKNQFVPEGATAQANGKTWAGPVNIARQTVMREVSILTLGADDNTSARIAAKAAEGNVMKLKKKFAAWILAAGFKPEMNDGELIAAKGLYKAQTGADADDKADTDFDPKEDLKPVKAAAKKDNGDGDDDNKEDGKTDRAANKVIADIRARAATEAKRQNDLSVIFEEYRPQMDAAKFGTIQAKAITGEYDATKAELEFVKARRPSAPNINVGAGAEVDGRMIAAAAARSMGIGEKVAMKGLDERAGNIVASMPGLTMHRIIAMSAARLGIHLQAGGIDDSFIDDFVRADKASHRQQLAAAPGNGVIKASSSAGFTTMSLTGITENILFKAMLEQYQLQTSAVPDICYEKDTNDFKQYKAYRVTAFGDLSLLGPNGEVKAMGLQDESYANQVATRAALMVLKREDIINDDQGALMQVAQVFGRKAALNREKAVFTALLSGPTTVAPGASTGKTANAFNFFSVGAKNFQSGGGSALSITSLTTAVQQYLQMKDANGDPIGIMPDRLVVPPELYATAQNLFNGMNLVPSGVPTSSAAQVPNVNQHAGKYRPIIAPYMGGQSSVSGATSTQWALLCNPAAGFATVQVGYLRGQRTPIIRQMETDANMLGIAYQGIYDFGVALLDFRCGQYSAGA